MSTFEELEAKLPFKLQDLQRQDILASQQCDNVNYFYEVGCGKTVCATMTALMWGTVKNYVVCPPIIIDQWAAWLYLIGETDVGIFRGVKRDKTLLNHKWVIVSHAIFRDSYTDIVDSLSATLLQTCIIVDEAQALKNSKSKLFRYCNMLRKHVRFQLLTGTPTSAPKDAYAYCHLVAGLYRSFGHWCNLYVGERDFFNNIKEYRDLDKVAQDMKVHSFKRTKSEIFGESDGINPIYSKIPYRLDPQHVKLYERLVEEQLLLLEDGGKIDAATPIKLYHACQQIVLNWAKFSGDDSKRSAGYDVLDEVIEETDCLNLHKSKLIVWTYYVASSEGVTSYLRRLYGDEKIAAAYGSVNSSKGVKAIMEDPQCRILVAQPTSVGIGLNLQHCCSEMLFLEMATVPAYFNQSVGRIARIGQKVKPTVRVAQAIGTIQMRLMTKLLANDDLVSRVELNTKSIRQALFGQEV